MNSFISLEVRFAFAQFQSTRVPHAETGTCGSKSTGEKGNGIVQTGGTEYKK